jgi:hypothetical protein
MPTDVTILLRLIEEPFDHGHDQHLQGHGLCRVKRRHRESSWDSSARHSRLHDRG